MDIKEILSKTGSNNDALEQFFAILDLPDEQFKTITKEFNKQVDEVLNTTETRSSILAQLKTIPALNNKQEEEGLNQAIESIKSNSELSDIKKEFLVNFLEKIKVVMIEIIDSMREKIEVQIQKIHENAVLPQYANSSDAGADIFAIEDTTIKPHTTVIIPTGLKVAIPAGYMIQIYSRSGLAAKSPLRIANSVGIIDHLYHKEIGVIIENTSNLSYTIKKGDKIAQMLIAPTPMISWKEVNDIEDTGRGGFGSTDSKS